MVENSLSRGKGASIRWKTDTKSRRSYRMLLTYFLCHHPFASFLYNFLSSISSYAMAPSRSLHVHVTIKQQNKSSNCQRSEGELVAFNAGNISEWRRNFSIRTWSGASRLLNVILCATSYRGLMLQEEYRARVIRRSWMNNDSWVSKVDMSWCKTRARRLEIFWITSRIQSRALRGTQARIIQRLSGRQAQRRNSIDTPSIPFTFDFDEENIEVSEATIPMFRTRTQETPIALYLETFSSFARFLGLHPIIL